MDDLAITLNRIAVGAFFMLSGYHKPLDAELLAPVAALGLLVVILVAIAMSGQQRIKVYKPIDEADRIDDWLYLPETLYAFMLIMVSRPAPGRTASMP